jgi:hypothetical protein
MALLREIGPGIRGIMVGNDQGVELSHRYLYYGWQGDARGNIMACANYVENVGGMLRDMGVAPFFAPMDLDILQDCYLCGGRLKDALESVGATAYVACGYTMVSGAYSKVDPQLTGEVMEAQRLWSGRDDHFPELRDYLQAGPFWSGLCGMDGIRAGNVEKLGAYGFSGFATKLEDEWLPILSSERGARWWS